MATLTTSWQNVASYRFAPGTGIIVNFYLDAKYSSQSIANNTTTIQTRLNCVLSQGSGSGTGYNFTLSYGSTKSGSGLWTFATETITTGNATITHNNDGTKNVTLSASMRVNYTGLDASMSATVTLPKINRYPQISNATNFTDEENPSMTFSNQGLYPVRVKIEAGGNTQLITRDISQTATSYTFELTTAERNTLRQLAQNSNTLTTRFTVCAMSGNSELSASYIDKTMTVVNANPTFTYTMQETNQNAITVLGGNNTNYLIQNVSVPNIVVTPTTLKYATVSRVDLTNGTYTDSKTTSPYSFSFTAINGTTTLKLTDSRGNNITQYNTKTLIEYQPVSINSFNFERQNPTSSNLILNADIKYYQKTFNETVNVPTIQWQCVEEGQSLGSWNTISSSDYTVDTTNNKITITNLLFSNVLDYRTKGTLYLKINDLLTEFSNNMPVIKGIPTMDMGEHDVCINGELFVADNDRTDKKMVFPNSIISANGDDSPTINIASDYGEAKLNIYLKNGYNYSDYFEISNNSIKVISDKVKKVLVSGQCMCGRGPNGYISLYIRQNGTTITTARHAWTDWNGETLTPVAMLVDVSENDYFELWFGGSKAGNYYKLSYGTYTTILNVQAIEIE